jgi:SAM-dependent methyltransferase
LESNPDVAEEGINPLLHYLLNGAREGRDPSPAFNTAWYLDSAPEVKASGVNPLAHYLTIGAVMGLSPRPPGPPSLSRAETDSPARPAGAGAATHIARGDPGRIMEGDHSRPIRSTSLRNAGLDRRHQLVSLADLLDESYRDIFAPAESGLQRSGVSSLFLAEGEQYHEQYFNLEYWSNLLSSAMALLPSGMPAPTTVLDVGTGSGNTIFPMLRTFSDAEIVACDVSPQLLRILSRALGEDAARVHLLCLDLNQPWFVPDTFDLAIGGAILHHLFEPDRLVAEVFRAVRPGGAVIFFEPFEQGHSILMMFYKEILRLARHQRSVNPQILQLCRAQITNLSMQLGTDKPRERYEGIDDKWLFTESYLRSLGREIGASEVIVKPLNSGKFLEDLVRTHLRLGVDLAPTDAPRWFWDVVQDIQSCFSDSYLSSVVVEGSIVFLK